MTDDTVLEVHNEDPSLVQMKLIGDGGEYRQFYLTLSFTKMHHYIGTTKVCADNYGLVSHAKIKLGKAFCNIFIQRKN